MAEVLVPPVFCNTNINLQGSQQPSIMDDEWDESVRYSFVLLLNLPPFMWIYMSNNAIDWLLYKSVVEFSEANLP